MSKDAAREIKELREEIRRHDRLYYVEAKPEISDRRYDRLMERLKALGDESRLEIIQLLKAEGELGTQEINDRFGLSKSAASRHIRQLVANGIIDVRVDEDGLSKFYRLNPAFMAQMQDMIGKLLG